MTPPQNEIDDMWDNEPELSATQALKDWMAQKIRENPSAFKRDTKNAVDSALQDYRNLQRQKEQDSGIREYHYDVHREGIVKHGYEWFKDKVEALMASQGIVGKGVSIRAATEIMAREVIGHVRYTPTETEQLVAFANSPKVGGHHVYNNEPMTWKSMVSASGISNYHSVKAAQNKAYKLRR